MIRKNQINTCNKYFIGEFNRGNKLGKGIDLHFDSPSTDRDNVPYLPNNINALTYIIFLGGGQHFIQQQQKIL